MKIIIPPVVDNTPAPEEKPKLPCRNEAVFLDGVSQNIETALHYSVAGSSHRLEADIMGQDNNGYFQYPVTIPSSIGTPLVRHSDGKPTTDEAYLQTTIVNGHIIAEGKLPTGDWKLLPERANKALDELEKSTGMPIPFRLDLRQVTFIVRLPI